MANIREEHHVYVDDGDTLPVETHEVVEEIVVPQPVAQVVEDVRVTETPTHQILERVRTIVTPEYRRRVKTVEDTSAPWRTLLSRFISLIYLFAGAVILAIGIRLILSMIGANPANTFAAVVYDVTDIFMWPFFGLAPSPVIGAGTLEIPAVIAMFIYAIGAFLLGSLLSVLFAPSRRIVSRQRITTQQRDV